MRAGDFDVVVLGAGVIGLTTAVRLAEADLTVLVRAREEPSATTSYAAGAIWGPYLAEHPSLERWSREGLTAFERLATDATSGVRLVRGVEASRTPIRPPAWAAGVADFELCPAAALPDGFTSGWRYTLPVIDMPAYLDYLTARLQAAGGKLVIEPVDALPDASRDAAVVVNCTGLGARRLVPDGDLTPVRGQLVVVENPGIDEFFAEHADDPRDLTYYLPHGDHVILGGTAEVGRGDVVPDPAVAEAIRHRCGQIVPALGEAKVREHRVGVRPTRASVRLEHVRTGWGDVVHNYGHGGAGVSISWGCAADVLAVVARLTGPFGRS